MDIHAFFDFRHSLNVSDIRGGGYVAVEGNRLKIPSLGYEGYSSLRCDVTQTNCLPTKRRRKVKERNRTNMNKKKIVSRRKRLKRRK